MRSISVETGLDDVKAYLNNCGYDIVDMADCIRPVEAVVYTGDQTPNYFASAERTSKNTALINAAGLTPEQVVAQLDQRLG